jgi:hypothetical protein
MSLHALHCILVGQGHSVRTALAARLSHSVCGRSPRVLSAECRVLSFKFNQRRLSSYSLRSSTKEAVQYAQP